MSFTTFADLEARLSARLDPLVGEPSRAPRREYVVNPALGAEGPGQFTRAAVLAPIVRRPSGWTMLLTQRTASMPTHAGQVAFPGGRVQPEDDGPVATALRETYEEIGVGHDFIRPIGRIETYETGTGYQIAPIVAFVEPGFELNPDPREVDVVFETPIAFLFDPRNHERREGAFRGQKRFYYAMPHNDRDIWGATAGMIRALYERLYQGDDAS